MTNFHTSPSCAPSRAMLLSGNDNHIAGIGIQAYNSENFGATILLIANKLIDNSKNDPVLEFAFQGPSLKYFGTKRKIVVTGDVNFKIIKKDNSQNEGECYRTIELDEGDTIDIISTNKSVYGYFSVSGGFKLNKVWGSFSTTIRAKIGSNNGNKLVDGQDIKLNGPNHTSNKKLDFVTNTNLSIDDTKDMIDPLKKKFPQIKEPNK